MEGLNTWNLKEKAIVVGCCLQSAFVALVEREKRSSVRGQVYFFVTSYKLVLSKPLHLKCIPLWCFLYKKIIIITIIATIRKLPLFDSTSWLALVTTFSDFSSQEQSSSCMEFTRSLYSILSSMINSALKPSRK